MKAPIGVHKKVPLEAYLSWDALSSSRLALFDKKSPWHARNQPPPDTNALTFGSAVHDAILLPREYKERYFFKPEGMKRRNSKEYKDWARDMQQRYPLAKELDFKDEKEVLQMRDAVLSHADAHELLKTGGGDNELSYAWIDHATNLVCRGRADRITSEIIVDIKTTRDASFEGFRATIRSYRYDLQAVHYLRGAYECLGFYRKFYWIAIEKETYQVAVYRFTEADCRATIQRYVTLLDQYANCERMGVWPSYKSCDMHLGGVGGEGVIK